MFAQVITAKVTDREALERQVDKWEQEIRPIAEGFLGSTSGVTDDGRLIVMARFESEEAARRNSERPEQDAWWGETEKLLSDVEFKDSVKVFTMRGGGSDDAGFVQVMRGRVVDEAKMNEMESRIGEFEEALSRHRPDVLGDCTVVHGDGTFSDFVYFTSEEEARQNESRRPQPGDDAGALFEEWQSLMEDMRYIDLRDVLLDSA